MVGEKVRVGKVETPRKHDCTIKHATPEMIKELDENQLSINAAYMKLKKENEWLKRANDILEGLEEEASNKIDSLEMKAQRLKEESQSLKIALKKGDNVEMRKEISDVRLAMRDLEEQKVAAEMLADGRLQRIKELEETIDTYKTYFDLSIDLSHFTYKSAISISMKLIKTCMNAERSTEVEDIDERRDGFELAKQLMGMLRRITKKNKGEKKIASEFEELHPYTDSLRMAG